MERTFKERLQKCLRALETGSGGLSGSKALGTDCERS